MSYRPLFYAVGFGILLVSLLFCHAYDINNSYIYYPLATFVGYGISMRVINYFSPTAFDAPPPPEPKTRQGKKKAAKEAEALAKRAEKNARKEADAARKAAEARARD
ncbi:hypothetical protein BX616_005567 [Lobosporangium transversale]|uniref:Uncharacterized protein n=1 Tax=Lobosporangium transversale TaxID=64571 RepID=A0A1Y2GPU9_9FUNG|nr:hypothetical protein BCR41DRAFT_422746 [Lobosporangium transversale]KAF9915712.1 hypothetical protein BX616_005567 [Lobosporangium transversale]ORZ13849.1 hypothetical protein BCR41DRAFT_422746 [Lobosporangium transversale]|eukprot:XP_021880633.1 hypothetical protein BCR41DRAFT_422746 [Lobosporangium transversale]